MIPPCIYHIDVVILVTDYHITNGFQVGYLFVQSK